MTYLSTEPAGTTLSSWENNNLLNCTLTQDTFSQVNSTLFRSVLIRYLSKRLQWLHPTPQGSIKHHIRADRAEKQASIKKINPVIDFSMRSQRSGALGEASLSSCGWAACCMNGGSPLQRLSQVRLRGSPFLCFLPELEVEALQGMPLCATTDCWSNRCGAAEAPHLMKGGVLCVLVLIGLVSWKSLDKPGRAW